MRAIARPFCALGWAVAVLAIAIGARGLSGAGPAGERVSRTFPATPGRGVTVRATVADVAVRGADRRDVTVGVTTRGSAEGASLLPIEIGEADGAVTVSVVQPEGRREPGPAASIEVDVPADLAFVDVDLFEGRVELSGLRRRVAVRVERGPISARNVAGRVRLETVSGSIRLDGADLPEDGMLRCRVFNGDVDVRLARRPADARILVLTLNGEITSSLALTHRTGVGPRFAETTVGPGTRVLSIDVVRGNIRLSSP